MAHLRLRYVVLALAASLVAAVSYTEGPAEVRPSVVPFTIESSGGSPRPVVTALFNGHPMRMMVHSDAGFFSQLRHKQAAAFGIQLAGVHESYGIDRAGHVSELGQDEGTVASLMVGDSEVKNAPVSVFEVPQPNLGMLGIGWINQNRVILDYRSKQAFISPTLDQAQKIGRDLLREGYVPLSMTSDEHTHKYFVRATINGVTRSMTVGTATTFLLDTGFADASGVKHGTDQGEGSGPTGTHVAEYALSAPVRVRIDGWTSPEITVGAVMDIYGYQARQRPEDQAQADGGTLGGDFFQKTDAVVDFGTRTLFVRGGGKP